MKILSKTENYKTQVSVLEYGEPGLIRTSEEVIVQDNDNTVTVTFDISIYYLWDGYNRVEYYYLLSSPLTCDKKILTLLNSEYCNYTIFSSYYGDLLD